MSYKRITFLVVLTMKLKIIKSIRKKPPCSTRQKLLNLHVPTEKHFCSRYAITYSSQWHTVSYILIVN